MRGASTSMYAVRLVDPRGADLCRRWPPPGRRGGRKVFVSFGSRRFPYLLDPEGFRIFCLLPPKCCAKSESKQELLLQPEHYVQNVSLTLSIRHPQDKSTGCRGANESDSQAGDRRQADKH